MIWWALTALSLATEFTVATLNIGHGRGSGRHQALQSQSKVQANVENIGASLIPLELDVVAFQESDKAAWWSGNQDQVQSLSTHLEMEHTLTGLHTQRSRLEYGTSLVSRYPITATQSVAYRSSFPLPPKGFVIGIVHIDQQKVAVVSIHLDPRRTNVRARQIEDLYLALQSVDLPLIVMGDFNVEWGPELEGYCDKLDLSAYMPTQTMVSFPKLNRRLDWILVGDGLQFQDYTTDTSTLSDHNVVMATVRLINSTEVDK